MKAWDGDVLVDLIFWPKGLADRRRRDRARRGDRRAVDDDARHGPRGRAHHQADGDLGAPPAVREPDRDRPGAARAHRLAARPCRHRLLAVRPRLLRPGRGVGIVPSEPDEPRSGASRGPRVRVLTDAGSRPPQPGSRDPWPHNRRRSGRLRRLAGCARSAAGCSRSSSTSTRASSPRRPARATEINSVVTAAAHKVEEARGPRARRARRAARGRRARAGSAPGLRRRLERHARPRRVRVRSRRPPGDRAAPAPDRVAGRARRPSLRRAADPQRPRGFLVRPPGQPQDRADLHRRADRAAGGRPHRGRHARPARPGRLVAGPLPALGGAGEAQPPR